MLASAMLASGVEEAAPALTRLENKYRARWELATLQSAVQTTPPILQIARSNVCNFKCVYCIDHRAGTTIPRSKLDGSTWQSMLALAQRSDILSFHGVSEFFVDPEFFNLVELCASTGATLSFNTNGSVCSEKHLDLLGRYPGPLTINFSLDAATPQTFLRIRGQHFWRILDHVRRYVAVLRSRRASTWISLSFVIAKSNVHEMVPFVFLGKALGVDEVKYYRLHEYEELNWVIPTRGGGEFDYRSECVNNFRDLYDVEYDGTRKAAQMLGLYLELPAPFSAPEEVAR